MNFIKNKLRNKDKFFYKDYYRAITILTLFSLIYEFTKTENLFLEISEVILFIYLFVDLLLGFNFKEETEIKNFEMVEIYVVSFPIAFWIIILIIKSLMLEEWSMSILYSILFGSVLLVSSAIDSLLEELDQ